MDHEQIWNDPDPIAGRDGLSVEVPQWIDDDISPSTIAAIVQGGCSSGAYMPAVTYWQAGETMSQHGDAVLDYIVSNYGELPRPDDAESWSGIACFYLSAAVEIFAMHAFDLLEEFEPESETSDDL